MHIQPVKPSRRGRPRRGALRFETLPPRLQEIYAAALDLGGRLPAMLRVLDCPRAVFNHRLSGLRALGLARTVTTYDPRFRLGDLEYRTLVRLRRHTPEAFQDFEAWCCADPVVTHAVYICGRFDYQLTSYHAGVRQADAWRRAMELRPEVGKVEQRQVITVTGHQLPGLPLVGAVGPEV